MKKKFINIFLIIIFTLIVLYFALKDNYKEIIELLLNADIAMDMEVFNNLNLTVITYGFNNKATFTVSSLEEKTIIIFL